jgi:hypothetical protein
MPVMVLCYALPGNGTKVANRIKRSGFDFKQFDFEIDRVVISNGLDKNSDKYLIFARQNISDAIPEDNLLFGLDDVEILFGPNQGNTTPPLNAENDDILTDENGIPLEL